MGKFGDNMNKTRRYMKKNGLIKTVFAASERLAIGHAQKYVFQEPEESILMQQREQIWDDAPKISVLVPAYETDEAYLSAMIESVVAQTYQNWELVIADGSTTDKVTGVVTPYLQEESRIRYLKLERNEGISNNTNEALRAATGSYIGLLDHDDYLTPDALWQVATRIVQSSPLLLYSDEDKTDESGSTFFEPNIKRKLNLDLILTNNYICHFCVIRADVMKRLEFRDEYDGAQDYDMILRTIALAESPKEIIHIPMVLYHWRCHAASTAGNTDSKEYAYESGRRAIVDFCMQRGWNVTVQHMEHLGFYRIEYIPDLFTVRPTVGVIGGPIYRGAKVAGGAMHRDGTVMYQNLPKAYSGYLHQAKLRQEVSVVDLRNVSVREELMPLYMEFVAKAEESKRADWISLSVAFCEQVKMRGYQIVYDPMLEGKRRNRGTGQCAEQP